MHIQVCKDSPSWVETCTKFWQLILSKIENIVATSCEILRLKSAKFEKRGEGRKMEKVTEIGKRRGREVPLLNLPVPLQLSATSDAAGF